LISGAPSYALTATIGFLIVNHCALIPALGRALSSSLLCFSRLQTSCGHSSAPAPPLSHFCSRLAWEYASPHARLHAGELPAGT
ncbi:MAG: hypothetical protein K2K97_01985, partial [Muribaculaceae bacterium]|nr:hypothetical protein [Muribaculaceae bacterium]